MDRNKLDQQLDRRLNKIDISLASSSNRKPIDEYDKYFFLANIPYEDAIVIAKVIICSERISGEFKGIRLNTYGPWVLFKVINTTSVGQGASLPEGAVVLAKWDNRSKVYRKYLYKSSPKESDVEVQAISSLLPVSEREIVTGKPD